VIVARVPILIIVCILKLEKIESQAHETFSYPTHLWITTLWRLAFYFTRKARKANSSF
jgi:hypothetical protein